MVGFGQEIGMENSQKTTVNMVPNQLSVVIPALPQAIKEDKTDKVIEMANLGILLVAGLTLFLTAPGLDLRWIAMGILILAATGLTYLSTSRQRKTVKKRMEFEERLHNATLQLAERNSSLKSMVQIDPLTELLNRRGLEKALTVEMSRARRKVMKVYGLLLDCDDFKAVNENFGHAVGDLVLQNMSKNILRSIRPTDYASRVGGDEFIVLIVDLDAECAIAVAERIRLMITDSPVIHGQKVVPCTASLGVAELPAEICSIEEVLTLCRMALSSSKAEGKNKITISGLHRVASISQTGEIDKARLLEMIISGQALRTVYQPIVRLSDRSIVGYEALTRGPEGPFEAPRTLFKLAQDNHALTPADMKAFKVALGNVDKVSPELRYHVNIFPATLLDIPLEALRNVLPPNIQSCAKICVEVSEQQFLGDPTCLVKHVNQLKSLGVLIALDDVGLVRSSLESLIMLEPDIIKVHENFTRGCSEDPMKQKYLARLVAMAASIDAELVAEGIESEQDAKVLTNLGLTLGQGFLFGRPNATPLVLEQKSTSVTVH